jgi:hypothetical protein
MHRTLVATIGAVIASAAFIAAQAKNPQPAQGSSAQTAGKTVTYVGCLGPGSSENTFLLSNAEEKGVKNGAKHLNFKVVAASEKVNLEERVTQQVEVTGTFGDSTPPAAASESGSGEKLPTLSATSVKYKADYCG